MDLAAEMSTLADLSDIAMQFSTADQPTGRRSIEFGHDESGAYILQHIADLSTEGLPLHAWRQEFEITSFVQNSPSALSMVGPTEVLYGLNSDFALLTYSGSGDVVAEVAALPGNQEGCAPADWAGFPPLFIALVSRGTCTFGEKAANAMAAGAVAVLIYDTAGSGPIQGTMNDDAPPIPVLSVSRLLGEQVSHLIATGDAVQMHVFTDTRLHSVPTYNVIVDVEAGDAANTVVVGAHLDSVPEGPGINDNGSGAAMLLEILRNYVALLGEGSRVPSNRVRFCWWGAEEIGLVGSHFYVDHLSTEDRAHIALNLNFDMVGSPNGVIGVYHGETDAANPAASGHIQDIFEEFFASRGLEYDFSSFDGRSDYGPFLEAGIPAGGIDTGADGVKTEEQAARFGGTAGLVFDPCYHTPCDTMTNVDQDRYLTVSRAAASALESLTFDGQLRENLRTRGAGPSPIGLSAHNGAHDFTARALSQASKS